MSAFKWWFKPQTVDALCTALANNPMCSFELHPENSDGTPLTDEQVKALGH